MRPKILPPFCSWLVLLCLTVVSSRIIYQVPTDHINAGQQAADTRAKCGDDGGLWPGDMHCYGNHSLCYCTGRGSVDNRCMLGVRCCENSYLVKEGRICHEHWNLGTSKACPRRWIYKFGRCFLFMDRTDHGGGPRTSADSWAGALRICNRKNGILIKPTTENEFLFAVEETKKIVVYNEWEKAKVFIGLILTYNNVPRGGPFTINDTDVDRGYDRGHTKGWRYLTWSDSISDGRGDPHGEWLWNPHSQYGITATGWGGHWNNTYGGPYYTGHYGIPPGPIYAFPTVAAMHVNKHGQGYMYNKTGAWLPSELDVNNVVACERKPNFCAGNRQANRGRCYDP